MPIRLKNSSIFRLYCQLRHRCKAIHAVAIMDNPLMSLLFSQINVSKLTHIFIYTQTVQRSWTHYGPYG